MPSLFKSAAALAMAGVAFANPMDKRYSPDSCAAAVTGKAALGDDNLRKEHCSSFFKTIVTPAAITVTTTITDKPEPTEWSNFKRDVTVCPNEVPNYASACDEAGYRSACNGWGISYETTFTIPATTTTKSVYVYNGGKGGVCNDKTVISTKTETSTVAGATTTVAGSTYTKTEAGSTATTTTTIVIGGGKGGKGTTVTSTVAGSTTTVAGSTTTVAGSTTTETTTVTRGKYTETETETVTVTVGGGTTTTGTTTTVTTTETTTQATTTTTTTTAAATTTTTTAAAQPTCLTSEKAKEFTDAFKNLLEYTDKGSAATNNGPYNKAISAQYLAENFVDYSDSINYMAHFPLGGITFPSRDVFDQQQGGGQDPLVITDVLTNFGCNHITWKWNARTPLGASVMGINHFIISEDLTQITINHAEFNSGAWIDSFKVYGTVPAINCQTPQQGGAAASNSTTSTGGTTRRLRL